MHATRYTAIAIITAKRQHGKRDAMPLAHAKGSTDIADKNKVDDTGDDGHM